MYKIQQLALLAVFITPFAVHADSAVAPPVTGKVAFVNASAGRITVGQSSINAARAELQGVLAGDLVWVSVARDSGGELFAREVVVLTSASIAAPANAVTASNSVSASAPLAGIIGTGTQGIIGTGVQGIIGTGIN